MPQYWVLQANPKVYFKLDLFLKEFIDKDPAYEAWWQVDNQPVRQGDYLFMWKADGDNPDSRGIYDVAMASTGPKDGAPRSVAHQLQLKRFYAKETWRVGTRRVRHVDIVYKYSYLVNNPVLAKPDLDGLWQAGQLPVLADLVRIRNRTDALKLRGKKILSPALPASEGRFLLGLIRARAPPLC